MFTRPHIDLDNGSLSFSLQISVNQFTIPSIHEEWIIMDLSLTKNNIMRNVGTYVAKKGFLTKYNSYSKYFLFRHRGNMT